MRSAKFNNGELVKLVNSGKMYTTYRKMFERLGFSNKYVNNTFKDGNVGQIFNIGYHLDHDYILYAIRDVNGNECLVEESGIERFTYKCKLPSFHFEIDGRYLCHVDENKFKIGCVEITKDDWKKIKTYVKESGFDSL